MSIDSVVLFVIFIIQIACIGINIPSTLSGNGYSISALIFCSVTSGWTLHDIVDFLRRK